MRWPFTSSHPAAALPDETPVDPEISFTFKLFHELIRQDPAANIFFSPCSVMLCLALVYDGATGETRKGMAKALELSGLDAAGVEDVVAQLRSFVRGQDAGWQLLIANSLWCNQSIGVDPEYAARARRIYDAEVREVNFAAS